MKINNKLLTYLLIGLSVFVLALGGIYFFVIDNKPQSEINLNEIESLRLIGSEEITIKQGEPYYERGCYAITKGGEIKSDVVEITPSDIDTSIPGEYYISYTSGSKLIKRKVIVLEKDENDDKQDLTLELIGDSEITLTVGEEYKELGYKATDSKEGDLTNNVKVTGEIKTTKSGTYYLLYTVTNTKGDKVTQKRTIIVKDKEVEKETENLYAEIQKKVVSDGVEIRIAVTGNDFSYIKLPDNTISKNINTTYKVKENGTYKFIIYDKNNNYLSREITVNEIKKGESDTEPPRGSCVATNKNGKANIVVVAEDKSGISKYEYYGNNSLLTSTTNTSYVASSTYSSVSVNVYDKYNNVKKLTCVIVAETKPEQTTPTTPTPSPEPVKNDFLEMHFIISGYNDDAILIRTGKATILIDSGRKGTEKKVLPYLDGLGIKTIDAIIGSHPHYNHIQTQGAVIDKYKVLKSYYPVDLNTCVSKNYCESEDIKYVLDAIKKKNIPMVVTTAGNKYTIGDMTLYFIGPYKLNSTATYKQNNNSGLFILKYKNNTFMFTGDAGTDTLNYNKVISYANKLGISLKVDMLKYPHHGNANLDTALVNAMKPKYAIVPNYKYGSKFNSSGKSKLKNVGTTIYQQATDGNIVLISDGNNITVKKNQSANSYKR